MLCCKYRCVSGYKQRQLPDGTLTCEATGERAVLLLAEGGELHAWQPRALRQHDDLALPTDLANRYSRIARTYSIVYMMCEINTLHIWSCNCYCYIK